MNTIDPSVFLAEGCRVTGTVTIGKDSSIWYNCVLRGDVDSITIGSCTNVQDLTLIHVDAGSPVVIGDHVTIGHSSVIHGCTIGDGSLIGMGSIILSGAKIGKDCLIGAGALVTGGMEIPDGSVVFGSPAKIRRAITEKELEINRYSAEHYMLLAEEHKNR